MKKALWQHWIGAFLIFILTATALLGPGSQGPVQAAAAPLTVSQAIAAQSGGGTATVEGYIVGHATGSLTAKFTSPYANDFNFLIADSPSEKANAKLLDVQVSSSFRSQYGLATNPSLVGKKVIVTGTLGAYNSYAGLKNPTSITLSTGTTNPDPEPGPGTTLPDGTGKKDCSIIPMPRQLVQQTGSLMGHFPTSRTGFETQALPWISLSAASRILLVSRPSPTIH